MDLGICVYVCMCVYLGWNNSCESKDLWSPPQETLGEQDGRKFKGTPWSYL